METPWNHRHAADLRREELLLDALHLERARAELEQLPDWSAAREEHLIERVLAATTRARDARPAGRAWLHERRWPLAGAAAGLVACLCVLALPERAPHGAPAPVELARSALPVQATVLTSGPTEPVEPVLARRDLALARNDLATRVAAARPPRQPALEALEMGADAPLELRLLEARARGLREHRWDTWLKEVPLADLGTLSLALWCEVQLDRFVLSGERPPAWRKAVAILEQGLERRPETGEDTRLLAHALERARGYGLAGSAGGDVEVARLEPGTLWTREWFEDLEAAGHEAGLAETGTWRAWVDWRGQ